MLPTTPLHDTGDGAGRGMWAMGASNGCVHRGRGGDLDMTAQAGWGDVEVSTSWGKHPPEGESDILAFSKVFTVGGRAAGTTATPSSAQPITWILGRGSCSVHRDKVPCLAVAHERHLLLDFMHGIPAQTNQPEAARGHSLVGKLYALAVAFHSFVDRPSGCRSQACRRLACRPHTCTQWLPAVVIHLWCTLFESRDF
jgi:hypothetical protein